MGYTYPSRNYLVYITFMSPIKNMCCSIPIEIVGSSSQQHGKEPYPWQPHPWHSWQRAEPCNETGKLRCVILILYLFITYLHLYLSYLILISFIYHRSFMTYLVSGAPNKFVANKVKTRGLQWPRPGLSARMSSWDALFEPKLWVLLSGQNMMNLWMIYGWDSIIFYLSIIMGYPYNLSI